MNEPSLEAFRLRGLPEKMRRVLLFRKASLFFGIGIGLFTFLSSIFERLILGISIEPSPKGLLSIFEFLSMTLIIQKLHSIFEFAKSYTAPFPDIIAKGVFKMIRISKRIDLFLA